MTRNIANQQVADKFTPEQIEEIKAKRKSGVKLTMLCFMYGISSPTLYRILKS